MCPFLRCFQPFTTILYPSLPAPCDCFLPPFIKVLTTGYLSFQTICELCFGPPSPFLLHLSFLAYSYLSFFSAPIFSTFYHYSRTGYEEKTTMRRLFLPRHNVRFWPRMWSYKSQSTALVEQVDWYLYTVHPWIQLSPLSETEIRMICKIQEWTRKYKALKGAHMACGPFI